MNSHTIIDKTLKGASQKFTDEREQLVAELTGTNTKTKSWNTHYDGHSLNDLLDGKGEFTPEGALSLIDKNNINTVGKNGSFLHHLVQANEIEALRELKTTFGKFLKINIKDDRGFTPLQCFLNGEYGACPHPGLAMELLDDWKAQDQFGNTILHHFLKSRCDKKFITGLLHLTPAILLIRNHEDKTAYQAFKNNNSSMLATTDKKLIYLAKHPYEMLAKTYMQQKQYDDTILICNDAIELFSGEKTSFFCFEELRGDAYSGKWNTENAIRDYEICIEKYKDYISSRIQIFYKLGEIYFHEKDYDKAIKQYENIILIDFGNHEAYLHRANALIKKKDFAWALSACNRSMDLISNLEQSIVYKIHLLKCHLSRGIIHDGMDKIAEALADYNEIIIFSFDGNYTVKKDNQEVASIKKSAFAYIKDLLSSDKDLSPAESFILDIIEMFQMLRQAGFAEEMSGIQHLHWENSSAFRKSLAGVFYESKAQRISKMMQAVAAEFLENGIRY